MHQWKFGFSLKSIDNKIQKADFLRTRLLDMSRFANKLFKCTCDVFVHYSRHACSRTLFYRKWILWKWTYHFSSLASITFYMYHPRPILPHWIPLPDVCRSNFVDINRSQIECNCSKNDNKLLAILLEPTICLVVLLWDPELKADVLFRQKILFCSR